MPEITVWTPERIAILRQHAYGKATSAQLAAMLGVSEDAVKTKVVKLGLRFTSNVEPHVRSRIADLAGAGWRPSRIARQLRLDLALVELHLPVSPCRASSTASRP